MASVFVDLVTWLKGFFYDEDEVDTLLAGKSNIIHTHSSTDVKESSELQNLDTSANASQHEINLAINSLINQGGGGGSVPIVTEWGDTLSDSSVASEKLTKNTIDTKQDILISGTSIKTVNNESLLGAGNITIQGGGGSVIGTGSFSIDNNGHLIVELPNGVDNPYFINNNGHLVYDTSNTYNGE